MLIIFIFNNRLTFFFREFVTKLGTAILSNAGSQLTKVDLSKNVLDDRGIVYMLELFIYCHYYCNCRTYFISEKCNVPDET